MNKVRIAHLTSVHPPFDTRIFHKECKTLANQGYDVVLIVPHDQDEERDGVRIRAVPKPRGRRERMTRTVRTVYRAALSENARLYHLHDPELLPIGLLLHLRGKKVVFDVHEDIPGDILSKHWIPAFLRSPVASAFTLFEKVCLGALSGIVAATPSIAARYPARKTALVQNFPLIGELAPRSETPYQQRSMNVTYIGSITEIRGIREMMEAICLLPESLGARFILGGTFSPESLEAELKASSAWSRVDYHGWVDREGYRRVLEQTRVGLVLFHPAPNHNEAQPNKLFEYMSAGIPLVASDFPLWHELIEGTGCGLLVNPLQPEAIAEAIEWLLTHPQEAEQMGKKGQSSVFSSYNWEVEMPKLLTMYEEIIK